MADVAKPNEAVELEHINSVRGMFKKPGHIGWKLADDEKVEKIYKIALKCDEGDPVGWVRDFVDSTPIHIKVGDDVSRLDQVLYFAERHLNLLIRDQTKLKRRRDF
jgi:hypothetical protein